MNSNEVLILGGGSGGLATAGRLKELLGDKISITVIDKQRSFVMGFSLLRVMTGEKTEQEVTVPKEKVSQKGIKFINTEVNRIDVNNGIVRTDQGEFVYDYLVVALGAELAPEKIPGFESAFHMYTLEDAKKLRDALSSFRGGSIRLVVSSTPFKCPPAPYEAAMLIDDHLRNKGLRDKSDIQIFTPEPQPMPIAGPEVGNMVVSMLNEKGIGFHSNTKVSLIDGSSKQIVFENGSREKYDLLIAIPPHTTPKVIRESGGLADASEWISVDPKNMQTKYDRVYAIGDVAAVKLPSGMMLPKAATFAFGQAEIVASNIASSVLGTEARNWDGFGECFIETGSGNAAYGSGSFYSSPKPVINLQIPSKELRERKDVWGNYWTKRLVA
ncbi:MAG TPA: FAD/NAD(P)-binding oxidoreductase [Nitrososphaera sp.]|jgi:sulfide:quinone oxidoreductase|nr:FAD/NAD(P)-binding oxidoreductase [Nitrososphaera sp.]